MTKVDILAAILGVLLFFVYVLSRSATRNKESRFNFGDAFLDDNGKTSMTHVLMFGAFIISSWAILAMTLGSELTEWALGAYLGAFVVNSVGRKFAESKSDNSKSN